MAVAGALGVQPRAARHRSALAWLREHFFRSPGSSAASVAALLLIAWLATTALQWLVIDAQWAGSGPQACPDREAACWPFVRDRLGQFFYGFYPPEHRWRVNLGLGAGAAALAGFLATGRSRGWLFLLIPVLAGSAIALTLGGWAGLERVPTDRWGGGFLSILVIFCVFALALPCGVLLALGRTSSLPLVRVLCGAWVEFWRAVPSLVVLFVAVVMFPLFAPEGAQLDKLLRALLALVILMSSYLAEALRGAIASVPDGQLEAARALGLAPWQRTLLVVLPQAAGTALPQIASNLIGLAKETTVLLVIGIPDLLGMVQSAAADPQWLGEGVLLTGYVFTAAVFWIFCFGLSQYSRSLESRLTAYRHGDTP